MMIVFAININLLKDQYDKSVQSAKYSQAVFSCEDISFSHFF